MVFLSLYLINQVMNSSIAYSLFYAAVTVGPKLLLAGLLAQK